MVVPHVSAPAAAVTRHAWRLLLAKLALGAGAGGVILWLL